MKLKLFNIFLFVLFFFYQTAVFAIRDDSGFDKGKLSAQSIAVDCSMWSKNLSCSQQTQQDVDNVLDQLSSSGGSPSGANNSFQLNSGGSFAAGNMYGVSNNVGIGSTNPGQILDVNGTTRSTTFIAGSGGITLGGVNNTSWPSGSSQWTTVNTNDVFLPSNGNVGLGTNKTTKAALSVMNGNVGIGTWVTAFPLDLNGSLGNSKGTGVTIASDPITLTGSTSHLITTANTEIVIGETGDADGESFLHILNRDTLNGAEFTTTTNDLVDFIFNPLASGVYQNIRYEHRGGNQHANTAGEFQIGLADQASFITGATATLIESGGTIIDSEGTGDTPVNALDVIGGVAFGSYAGANTAPVDGLILDGNVGIGNPSPGYQLDVNGVVNGTDVYQGGNPVVYVLNGDGFFINNSSSRGTVTLTNATHTQNTVIGSATSTTPANLAVPSCSASSSALTWTTNTGFGCNTISGSGTNFWVNDTGNVGINTSYNVGIGTISQLNTLVVKGNASFGTYNANVAAANSIVVSGNVGVGTYAPIAALEVGTGNTPNILTPGGNVSIGTKTAGSLLTVGSTGQFTVSSAGAVTSGTINSLTLTTSTGTLTISNGKVVTISNTLTFAGTDSTTITFQGTDTYVGRGTTDTLTNKRMTLRQTAVTQSATPTINTDNMDIAKITGLAQAITSFTTNLSGTPVDGDLLEIRITDSGTARGITWGTSFESTTVTLPTTTVISTELKVFLQWNSVASKWDCVGVA